MMGFYGYSGMMGSGWGSLVGFIVLIDLILVGIWLFKQINK